MDNNYEFIYAFILVILILTGISIIIIQSSVNDDMNSKLESLDNQITAFENNPTRTEYNRDVNSILDLINDQRFDIDSDDIEDLEDSVDDNENDIDDIIDCLEEFFDGNKTDFDDCFEEVLD